MSTRLRKTTGFIGAILILAYLAIRVISPPMLEKSLNKILAYPAVEISADTQRLHDGLLIMDWHADTLLWSRDFLDASDYGQVDLPRLQKGGMNIQMLTTVTKSPSGQNYAENAADAPDSITLLAVTQGWPIATWTSLFERALYQAQKLEDVVARSEGRVRFIKSKADLAAHNDNSGAEDGNGLAVLLGAEGAHALEGDLANIDRMFAAGFRMIGLLHFFDNEIGGSLHGTSKAGLTDFGRAAVKRFDELGIIIDLAHASEAVAREVTALSNRPQVVSHTGLKGNCDSQRNFPDSLMQTIAAKGGLIAVGFWKAAVCDPTPTGIAAAITYGIGLVGADHIALGSDWDGSVEAISADALAEITQALVAAGVTDANIAKVMGANSVKFLQAWLPDS